MADKAHISETDIIERYFAPLAAETPGAFSLGDDAGLIQPPDGMEVVLTTDVILSGVHFLEDAAPQDVAYKALAVNVSDLCAKGADPAVYLLSLALPDNPDVRWLEGIREGLSEAQTDFACTLLGGDTVRTPGPATLSITAAGYVPKGRMVHRSSARKGDTVYVTGTIGDAALGLLLCQDAGTAKGKLSVDQIEFLRDRYRRPRPRIAAIDIVRRHANAAMDVSDGLAGDFIKLCAASNAGGSIDVESVPLSDAAASWIRREPERMSDAITGGDDYEILLTVSRNASAEIETVCVQAGISIAPIGRILTADNGVEVRDEDGNPLELSRKSFTHF
ncbi:MAG: thiamine-phosphate kinase [Methyloligellaceae bacterium]